MYNSGIKTPVASGADTINDSKYSVSKNPSTGLYYKLHIMKVGVSDLKKYKCERHVNEGIQSFYLQLILAGRCNYTSAIVNCLIWWVHNAGSWDNVAGDDVNINDDTYSNSKNPPTALYYRLHILNVNVGVSDVKKYKCETSINGDVQSLYVQLTFIGRCNYILVIFKVVKQDFMLVGNTK